ncbi:divalent-cation tolerance protein CutA [Marinihelvus fidelis]|uniref:Divalent-cation tolerance protein CutA n=1 Tax=Marinihelvus fidelis TaxID=2613842 RepID=A0A5N0T9J9_9GAMM|nr:divalent-cation tolerance protein CutA [Marinihelvus fidelis]KAA9131610.1 divalent-cation tolerance protein CutA [Marinihelvus fidelis]
MNETITIFCTCPDEETAGRLAEGLVEARHAACVNILPGVRSVYRWEDRVERAREALMIIKTTSTHFFVIERWMAEHHPYDVPELVAVRAEHVSEPYLAWLRQSVSV